MKDEERVKIILDDISANFKEFLRQAKSKLQKHSHIIGNGREGELVSDVLFTIFQKLNDHKQILRFHKMAREGKLSLYVLKAISTNTSFFSSPFYQKNIKKGKKLELMEFIPYTTMIYDPDKEEVLKEEREHQEFCLTMDVSIANEIYSMFDNNRAPKIFGEDWKYFRTIFFKYVKTPTSYAKMSRELNIPISNLYSHLSKVKKIILSELEKNNIKRIY